MQPQPARSRKAQPMPRKMATVAMLVVTLLAKTRALTMMAALVLPIALMAGSRDAPATLIPPQPDAPPAAVPAPGQQVQMPAEAPQASGK